MFFCFSSPNISAHNLQMALAREGWRAEVTKQKGEWLARSLVGWFLLDSWIVVWLVLTQ